MKKFFVMALAVSFLAGGLALAKEAGSPSPTHKVHHPKKGKGKPKNTLNPQPLPPRVAPGTNPKSGAPGGDKSEINKNQ